MNSMDKDAQDKFIVTNKAGEINPNNFFISGSSDLNVNFSNATMPSKRLNDYDSKLLEDGAYKDVADDTFKLEYKISKTENLIKETLGRLQAAIDINDFKQAEIISENINMLKLEHQKLVSQYNSRSVSAKVSESLFNVFGKNLKLNTQRTSAVFSKYSDKLKSKLPQSLAAIFELKNTLSALENINKSVDNLMSTENPIGEDANRYDRLSKFIIKANSIQSQINKRLKDK